MTIERADVDAALAALFDLHREVVRVRELLEEEDGEPPQEDEGDA